MKEFMHVPPNLRNLVTDEVREVHERWQHVTAKDVSRMTAEAVRTVDIGDRRVRIGKLGDNPEGPKLVFGLPHQQTWKDPMTIRAMVLHEIVNPNGETYVLPNNGRVGEHYELKAVERMRMRRRKNLEEHNPYGEMWARTLDALDVADVALVGYSGGGYTGLAIAVAGPKKANITHIVADETPSNEDFTERTLRKAFTSSGTPFDQRHAIKESGIPVLNEVYSIPRLAVDYALFGEATLNPDNKALHAAMAGSVDGMVGVAFRNYPGMRMTLGHVEGSNLFLPESVRHEQDEQFAIRKYEGAGIHRHPTADNPIVNALMVLDGTGRL